MGFSNNWVTCCNCGSCISSCHREGERKVASCKDRYNAEGLIEFTNIRAWCRGVIRVGFIDDDLEVFSCLNQLGEAIELNGCASDFSTNAAFSKSGLSTCCRNQLFAGALNMNANSS